jgi:uncharacterized protein YbaR (Trm112 family)
MIGKRLLRRNHGYPDEPVQWVEFTCNETYLRLIEESPQDFTDLDGDKILVNVVSCDICENEWLAMYFESSAQLECPKCRQMADYEIAPQPNTLSSIAYALFVIDGQIGDRGGIVCPACGGTLYWTRSATNGHVWGKCNTRGCLSWPSHRVI